MNHTYHVHTPFSRAKNLPMLHYMMSMTGVRWTIICEESEKPAIPKTDWADVMICDKCPDGYFPGNWKSNWFLDHTELKEGTRYLCCNDDDFYEPGFFPKIDAVEGKVLICSMHRAQDVLFAEPGNVRGGLIGGEQLILDGSVQKDFRYGNHYAGDWDMIAAVTAKHRPEFARDAYVLWNYLDPGRWKEVLCP